MVNARDGATTIEGCRIPTRKKKPARQRARQKQKSEIIRRSGNQEIRAVCPGRVEWWEVASVVIPVDGSGLSFRLGADAVVRGEEIRLLIVSYIVQERARACADQTLGDKVNAANRLRDVLPIRGYFKLACAGGVRLKHVFVNVSKRVYFERSLG